MELHKTSDCGLYANLSRQDLSAYELTFDTLDPQDERTETLIRAILTQAEQTLGFAKPPRGNLFVDALPTAHGGTLLFLSTRRQTRYRVKKQPFTLLCRVDGANALLALLHRLKTPPFSHAGYRLYRDTDRYILHISFPASQALRAGRAALTEYGDVFACDAHTQAYLQEYAELLIRKAP